MRYEKRLRSNITSSWPMIFDRILVTILWLLYDSTPAQSFFLNRTSNSPSIWDQTKLPIHLSAVNSNPASQQAYAPHLLQRQKIYQWYNKANHNLLYRTSVSKGQLCILHPTHASALRTDQNSRLCTTNTIVRAFVQITANRPAGNLDISSPLMIIFGLSYRISPYLLPGRTSYSPHVWYMVT